LQESQSKDKDGANTSRFQIILDINSGSQKLENIIKSDKNNQEI